MNGKGNSENKSLFTEKCEDKPKKIKNGYQQFIKLSLKIDTSNNGNF